jgi:hypothetical protein
MRHLFKQIREKRERMILDILETHGRSISVSSLQNEFLGYALRGFTKFNLLPRCRLGGDPFNEADLIPPKVPWRITLRYKWRYWIRREVPSEEKLRDALRNMATRGIVEFIGDDSWQLSPHSGIRL